MLHPPAYGLLLSAKDTILQAPTLHDAITNGNVLFALAILGLIVPCYFAYYLYNRTIRRVFWTMNDVQVIQDRTALLPDLGVTYKGQSVDNLTISTVAIWNPGEPSITKANIPTGGEFVVKRSDASTATILDASVIYPDQKLRKFSVVLDDDANTARIDFPYLNQGDGAALYIVHTGPDDHAVELSATLTDTRPLRFIPDQPETRMSFMVLAAVLLFVISQLPDPAHIRNVPFGYTLLFLALALLVTGLLILWPASWVMDSVYRNMTESREYPVRWKSRLPRVLWWVAHMQPVPRALREHSRTTFHALSLSTAGGVATASTGSIADLTPVSESLEQ
jgi:hypothetical protein